MGTNHSAESHSARVATVLQLVVQHCPAVSSTPAQLCTLLQLNQACRAAVQEAVGHLSISSGLPSLRTVSGFADFAAWLPKHAGLVSSIELTSMRNQEHQDVVKQLMTLSLQACSRQQVVPTIAGHTTGCTRVMLQLQLYTTDFLHSSDVLQALAAATALTALHLESLQDAIITPAWCAAMAQLTSLRALKLTDLLGEEHTEQHTVRDAMAAISTLKCLQSLDIENLWVDIEHLHFMPRSLKTLLLCLHSAREEGSMHADLRHLQSLERLSLAAPDEVELMLPASINCLLAVASLLAMPFQEPLPNLQFVGLHLAGNSLGFVQQVLRFHSLTSINLNLSDCAAETLSHLFAAVGAATQLTSIRLRNAPLSIGFGLQYVDHSSSIVEHPFLREHLHKLPLLQSFALSGLRLPYYEGMHLTGLSKLTCLHLDDCSGVDDLVVVAIAGRLTDLRRLTLHKFDLHSSKVWVALAGLASLQHLSIMPTAPNLPDDVLQLLAPLTNLTMLQVGATELPPSDAAVAAFLAQVPQLTGIEFV